MTRSQSMLAALALALGALALHGAAPAQAQARLYVNTTEDLPSSREHCLPGKPCPFRGAVEKAESLSGGAVITACYDPELVPNAAPCAGPGAQPLTAEDEAYDPETGQWTIRLLRDSLPFDLTEGGTKIDFRLGFAPYAGPQDNRIVFDATGANKQFAFKLESRDNQIAGIEVRGDFRDAAILLNDNLFGDGAANNVIGPGNVFAGITEGNAVKIKDPKSVNNRVVGNWCGVRGDGTEVSLVSEDCIFIGPDSSGNVVGGPGEEDRNVFAATQLGVGVKVQGPNTRETVIQNNWFGLDAKGMPSEGLESGVLVIQTAFRTRIVGNVVAGSRGDGIAVFEVSPETLIEANHVGVAGDLERCAGNGSYGIALQFGPVSSRLAGNVLRCNDSGGILLAGRGTHDNRITQNRIAENGGEGIHLIQGANGDVAAPRIDDFGAGFVAGTSCPGCLIEVFSDPSGDMIQYEGMTTADATTGTWRYEAEGGFSFRTVSATATDGRNTSPASIYVTISDAGTPTPGRPTPTPTPRGTGPVLFEGVVYLPWTGRDARGLGGS